MGKIKLGELFLKERICNVMEDIKKLNNEKIDTDVEKIKNGTPLEDIFFRANHSEINNKLWNKQNELKLLIAVLGEGFEYLEKMLPQLKDNFDEETYNKMEEMAKYLIETAYVEIDEETGDVC